MTARFFDGIKLGLGCVNTDQGPASSKGSPGSTEESAWVCGGGREVDSADRVGGEGAGSELLAADAR